MPKVIKDERLGDSSCDCLKRLTRNLSSKMKRSSLYQKDPELLKSVSATGSQNESEIDHQKKGDKICKTRKKVAVICPIPYSSSEEEIDLDKQLGKGKLFDDKECMWLSSDSPSPSSFFEEYKLSSSLHLSVDHWLISWLSTIANSYLHLDKAIKISNDSIANLKEKPSSAPERTNPDEENILEDEKRSIFPLNSPWNDVTGCSAITSESLMSSCGQCYENSSSCDSSLTLATTNVSSTSSSHVSDFDRIFLASLVDFDDEDSQWVSDAELENSQLGLFPSLSWKANCSLFPTPNEVKGEHLPYDISPENNDLEAAGLEEFNSDQEPLFWPCEPKLHWSSEETWKCFAMSPRKDSINIKTLSETSSKPIGSKNLGVTLDSKEDCRKKLELSSGSAASEILEWKKRNTSNSIKKVASVPSRLRKSIKILMKIVPLEVEDDRKEAKDGNVTIQKANYLDKDVLENDFLSDADLPIETLLGLDEFDGHEGVDSEFNEDVFILDDSL